jgi:predicted ATPase/class 3 adenylate cyclase
MQRRAPLPTGTVTLLFTDIEGSTQRWEAQRTAMPTALRRHDQLLRTAIETHGGHVFKTVGDQFCAVFSRAADAVAAAVDAQRAIASQDWTDVGGLAVRMALHSGATEERDADYFGPAVNRVARLLDIVHGGQVVVSGTTTSLLRGAMPSDAELRDLGEHRLKDLVEPEHVWQLVAPGLPDTFPPLRSLGSLPNNLPRQLTQLIGRDAVVAEIESLVLEHPLVTLVGPGGVGKTRLALQVGAQLLDGSADGVWFVELGPLSDPALLANAVAAAFGLREQANRSTLDVLMHYLRSRRLLLILDNCEHLIYEAARVADALLRSAPDVRILATSREPLRIGAEHVYRVPSLAVPSSDSLSAQEALQYGATALFAERATASDANFKLTDENAPAVGEICRRLDGIALAIELAAARAKTLPPPQLAKKLDERFRVLTGGSRTALPRQRTMRALIAWSHDLLGEPEQRLFRRLAIFVGGWTLDAAEAVCTDGTLDALDVDDLLASLVEKSLVVAEAESPRYGMLESTRAFALEQLEQSGEREELARRHALWLSDLSEHVSAIGRRNPTEVAVFAPELKNARAAIEWAILQGHYAVAARIILGFAPFAKHSSGISEVGRWLDVVMPQLDGSTERILEARLWASRATITHGTKKLDAAKRALQIAESSGDMRLIASCTYWLAFSLLSAGRVDEAAVESERGLQLCRQAGQTLTNRYASGLILAGDVAETRGLIDEARPLYREGLAIMLRLGDEVGANLARVNLSIAEFGAGNEHGALGLAEEILTSRRTPDQEASAFSIIAACRLHFGDVDGSCRAASEVLELSRKMQDSLYATAAIVLLGVVAAKRGDVSRGARLGGYAEAWFARVGAAGDKVDDYVSSSLRSALLERLSTAEIEALSAEGATLTEDQAVAEARAVGAIGEGMGESRRSR